MNDPLPLRLGAVVRPPAPVELLDIDLGVKWIDNRQALCSDMDHEAFSEEKPAEVDVRTWEFPAGADLRAIQGEVGEVGVGVDLAASEDATVFMQITKAKAAVVAEAVRDFLGELFARTESGEPDVPAAVRGGGVLGGEVAAAATAARLLARNRAWAEDVAKSAAAINRDYEQPYDIFTGSSKGAQTATGMRLMQDAARDRAYREYQDARNREMRRQVERAALAPLRPYMVTPAMADTMRAAASTPGRLWSMMEEPRRGCNCEHCRESFPDR